MLVHARTIINAAYRRHRAVVAFNTINAETTWAIARAATAARQATLYEVSEKTIAYLGFDTVVALIRAVASAPSVTVPLAMHLDHGRSLAVCAAAVRAGFSSVMIDASALPFNANVRLTRRVVEFAHRHRVIVQGEIGALARARGARLRVAASLMTDPAQAHEFVRLTGVDTLGVAVGTLHGPMKIFHKLPKIDFPRLACIHDLVRVPLVLHGASGVPAADLRRAEKLGVSVINIDTDLRLAYLKSLRQELKRAPHEYDPRVIFEPVVQAMEDTARRKLRGLGH